MAETKIQWADFTFNPYRGCTKVSAGCANCYADTMSKRNPGVLGIWGPQGTRVVASETQWKEPLKWNKDAEWWCDSCESHCFELNSTCRGCGNHCRKPKQASERPRVFCASLADVFEDWKGYMTNAKGERLSRHSIKDNAAWFAANQEELYSADHRPLTMQDVRNRLFALIDQTPNLDWLLLTKRPENIERMMPGNWLKKVGTPVAGATWKTQWENRWSLPPNVWIGTSVENQQAADERIPHLLKVPAKVRFLSVEPLLGAVDLFAYIGYNPMYETTKQRIGNLSGSPTGSSGDYARRHNLESGRDERQPMEREGLVAISATPPSGTRSGPIFSGSTNDWSEESILSRPSVGMDALQRPNSADDANQSHQWRQKRQPARESRTGDTLSEHSARGESFASGSHSESIRSEEPCGEIDRQANRGGEGNLCERNGNAIADRQEVWSGSPNHIEDRERRQATETKWADGGLHISQKQGQRQPPIGLVIIGGESGPNARQCHIDWIRDIVRQCKAAGVPVFVKQLGSESIEVQRTPGMTATFKLGLRDSKGGNPAEWPEYLRVRELPEVTR